MPATTEFLTAEELLLLPDSMGPAELVRGAVRLMSYGSWAHATVAANAFVLLWAHVRPRQLGQCFPDGAGFRFMIPGATRDTVRSPDAAFVYARRVPLDGVPFGWIPFAPDLAVEVLSPSDTVSEFQEKLDDYCVAGTSVVWAIDPARHTVEVHTPDAPVRRLREGDTLDGVPVLPDFRCTVAELFEGLAPPERTAGPA